MTGSTPTAILLIGVQGSGKSSFYQAHFATTHRRINLDTLRTRAREAALLQTLLAEQQSFVVDNTNVTVADRARYISPARAAGFTVIGYYFDLPLADCLRRNAARTGRERVPPQGVRATFGRLAPPTLDEGFAALYRVTTGEDGSTQVAPLDDRSRHRPGASPAAPE